MSWEPGKQVVRSIDDYARARRVLTDPFTWDLLTLGRAWAAKNLAVVRHRFWSAVAGCDIPVNTFALNGVELPHPTGVVIHPDSFVGPGCKVFQGVTIGMSDPTSGVPKICRDVEVGAGAMVLGDVIVGEGARVGANAVVLDDVPPRAVVVGAPARVVRYR